MPEIVTRQFGSLSYSETAIIEFPVGLPGFENGHRFVLVERSASAPLVFLQNIELPELCFCAAPVEAIDPKYQLAMTEEDERLLGASGAPLCLAILSQAPGGSPVGSWTANLLAPVVIDLPSRRAVQAVRADTRYSHVHPVGASCS